MLLTAEELKKRLGISSNVYYKMRKAGELPPVIKIGKRVRYPEDKVQEWINQNTK